MELLILYSEFRTQRITPFFFKEYDYYTNMTV